MREEFVIYLEGREWKNDDEHFKRKQVEQSQINANEIPIVFL